MDEAHHADSPASTQSPCVRPRLGEFLPPIVFSPSSSHRSTIIFLHGRGWSAGKFAGPLLSTQITEYGTFRDALPHTKFIFPTAPLMRATKYRRSIIHQWYDGTGDWEPEARGNMRQSIQYIHGLLRQEMQLLGSAEKLVLAGISQGCAMALVSMLLWDGPALGAAIGVCGFMPLSAYLSRILNGSDDCAAIDEDVVIFESDGEDSSMDEGNSKTPLSPLQRAIAELLVEAELDTASPAPSRASFLSTPVFLGHGTEDKNVELHHGKQAAALLELMGIDVEFNTYHDLGHWYSEDMLKQIIIFLADKACVDTVKSVEKGPQA